MRILDPGWKKFGSGIRDGKKLDPGSGKTSRIRNTGGRSKIFKELIDLPKIK
jgi:hypothetical protein